jgi:glutamate/tyrosine decarboxylase-like PLP-dependent enzyme
MFDADDPAAPPDAKDTTTRAAAAPSLDPADWDAFRAQAHRMLDDMVDFLAGVRDRPVWQPVPDAVKARLAAALPVAPTPLDQVYAEFKDLILPYATGNIHPGFLGWVHGSGTPTGMLAEMLAAAMNANVGGRDHGAVYVERQVVDWCRDIFGFPAGSSGVLVTGTSMANLIGLQVARTKRLGRAVRAEGLGEAGQRLVAYASNAAHGCIAKAMEISGLGTKNLRRIAVDDHHRIDLAALARTIELDRRNGLTPFLVVGTAGSVDIGAIDDLGALAELCAAEKIWFHVDGAFGAMARLAPELAPLLAGIERADSLAFDFHKWLHVPYDAACILVRDGALHAETFSANAAYLARVPRGLAAGAPWFCDYGPDLSRGFRALKVWFTLKEYGTARLGEAVLRNVRLARYLADRIAAAPELELLAPVGLNIVCFRYRQARLADAQLNALNADLVADVQESGVAAPSTTLLDKRLAIRVNITNHRTDEATLDALVAAVIARGKALEPRYAGRLASLFQKVTRPLPVGGIF